MPSTTADMHFMIELDTANTFDTGDLRQYATNRDQTGWEYFDGADWVAFPAAGVDTAYAGNDCRFTVSVPLAVDTWYRRVKGGITG